MEKDAASLLGYMLFEFSRLDVSLGLSLVWVNDGENLESHTKSVARSSFNARLEELSKHIDAKLRRDSESYRAYEDWIRRADAIRQQRNELVHGRWGVEAHQNCVVNVVSLPISETQKVTRYSTEELSAVNDKLHSLRGELEKLRDRWPL